MKKSRDRARRALTEALPEGVISQAAAFHGHLGPWLVLGLKAGAHARRTLAASPFDLKARVFCPAGTPYTCFIDGVQFSSGCTMGKGNIVHRRAKGCRVAFTRTGDGGRFHHKDTKAQSGSGTRLRLALRTEVWDELHARSGGGMPAVERMGREFNRRRLEELFAQ